MKRSNVIILTLAGVGLGVTGYNRTTEQVKVHSTAVLPPESLSPAMRASLPPFFAGTDVSRQSPPHNAYDPQLGYYHQPCSAWFPYPYDHYDQRWGYYRCGRWSRHHSTKAYPSSSTYFRGGFAGSGSANNTAPSTTMSPPAVNNDYALQPTGAPIHTGVPQSQASMTRSAFTSRGGFGRTGGVSGFFSGS